MYILGDQRDEDVESAFKRYKEYLKKNRGRFPESAYELATSDWYFGFDGGKAPHDGWLESFKISEPTTTVSTGEYRTVSINIELLSAYHDGIIEFHYPEVFEYKMSANLLTQGHGDWRYDEFRLNDEGHLVHEIEWATYGHTCSWIIVADDVLHNFRKI